MTHHTARPERGAHKAISRRTAVGGAGAVALAGFALAGCAADEQPATPAGSEIGNVDDVPVGGGTVFEEAQVVVTQPAGGEFKAFSAVCPHQGCVVRGVAEGTINCECHGSKFDINNGEVKGGPSNSPLPERRIDIDDDGQITVA